MEKHLLLKIWLISVFLLMSGFSQATENYGEEKGCKNLGKVTDIDNLLYQFYSNIDSQCLFEIPTQELQKIWAVRIYDYTDLTLDENIALNKERNEIMIKTPNMLIVSKTEFKGDITFHVFMGEKYNQKGWGGSIGNGDFPKLLPTPEIRIKCFIMGIFKYSNGYDPSERPKPLNKSAYKACFKYFWLNKNLSRDMPALYASTHEDSNVIVQFDFVNKASNLNYFE